MKTIKFKKPQPVVCDTNLLIALYSRASDKIGPRTDEMLSTSILVFPAMVQIELDFLYEIKRINRNGQFVFGDLIHRLGAIVDLTPMFQLAAESEKITWTRDPFDRLIVATALALNAPL